MDQGRGEGLEGQEGARVRLALRQRAGGDRRRGGQARQGERIVEQGRGPLPTGSTWAEPSCSDTRER